MAHALKILKFILLLTMIARKDVVVSSNNGNDDERCYQPYGCFNRSPPWNNPLAFELPESPSQIGTSFKLYNAAKPNGVLLDNADPTTSEIQAGDKIVVLIHGLSTRGGHDESMYTAMRPELLARTNANGQTYLNVITVDWTGGVHDATSPSDFQAIKQSNGNGRLVAAQIFYLLKKLKSRGKLSCDDVHIIGFSIGASIAGLVGKAGRTSRRCIIDRITGLDPVLSGFGILFGVLPDETKLHSSDAKYVDVIHTRKDPSYTGRVGKVDFLPNGGSSQPGCTAADQSCHHFRAVEIFSSTILPSGDCCSATKCRTYQRFKDEKCKDHHKRPMGFAHGASGGPTLNGKYMLRTGDSDPYCGPCSGGKKH